MAGSGTGRKTVSLDEGTYKKLIKAKAELELQKEEDISIGEVLGAVILGGLAIYGAAKLYEEYARKK